MLNISSVFSAGALLHVGEEHNHGIIGKWLEGLGRLGEFIDEVILHGLSDTLILVPFLFLTYLLMEFIEHKASQRTVGLLRRAGSFGPLLGGALGAVPQCGFSAVAANLYTAGVVGMGTLVAVFLSTSDEMIPILLGGNAAPLTVLYITLYKAAVGIAVGFLVQLFMRLGGKEERDIDIDAICEEDNCHCERGILHSALHHTLTVSLFILAVTLGLNALMFFVDGDAIGGFVSRTGPFKYSLCSLVGLIPNCASSVLLTKLCLRGVISTGAMISGLLTGAGVGILVLFRMNRSARTNLTVLGIVTAAGVIFGALADFLPFGAI